MRNAKGALTRTWTWLSDVSLLSIVMRFTKVGVTAAIESFRAAQVAFPSDVLMTMFWAVKDSTSDSFDSTCFAS